MAQASDKRPHLVLTNTSRAKPFTAHSSGGGSKSPIPQLDRLLHGVALQAALTALKPIAAQAVEAQNELELQSGLGLQIQFVGLPDVKLAFESLSDERSRDPRKKIEVLSVRNEDGVTIANVFVPDGMLSHFEQYVAEYLADKRDKSGKKSLDHKALINTIASIRAAEMRALWTDELDFPADPTEQFWWEVWLPVRGNRDLVVADFRKLATLAECAVSEHQINFPERTVVLMHGSQQQFSQSVMILNCVAELRRAKDTADFFDGLPPVEQFEWVNDALARLQLPSDTDSTPRVCLLDSGVNRGHPLLAPLIGSGDLHSVNASWGTDDQANHGSGLAGLVWPMAT